ncbi:hypothetical protein PsorP6_008704 [Peronosclerospora sorghi]|uniref:Uncharacterized protein n=1 Tax=Peronosclerospora sorghi TaxID=230839 RepID=A0ACC0VXS9_9STRA|nr:hypothetical protein PsorP6_008704 [Peronosclerospora sorghi]
MLDDLIKLLRSPRWISSPIARRFGFGSELSFDEDATGKNKLRESALNRYSLTRAIIIYRRHTVELDYDFDFRPLPSRPQWSLFSCWFVGILYFNLHQHLKLTCLLLAVGDVMYVFGGYNDGTCHNDIYAFDLIRHHWQHIETSNGISPGMISLKLQLIAIVSNAFYIEKMAALHTLGVRRRMKQSFTFLVDRGLTGDKPTWFNVRDRSWKIVEATGDQPPPGYGQSLCALNNKLYLFGGTSGHVYVNDLYVFDEITNVWKKEETRGSRPSPRYKHQVAVVENRMYVIGGGLYEPPKGPIETHYLDVNTLEWNNVECSGNIPKSRIAHTISQLSSDPYRLIMFGGRDESGLRQNELSELNLRTAEWRIYYNEEGYQPDARDFHTSVVHNDRIFVFGGSNGVERSNDVFRFTMTHQPSTLTILAMQVLHQNIDSIPKEELDAMPIELQLGLKKINSDVECTYNLVWYDTGIQQKESGILHM